MNSEQSELEYENFLERQKGLTGENVHTAGEPPRIHPPTCDYRYPTKLDHAIPGETITQWTNCPYVSETLPRCDLNVLPPPLFEGQTLTRHVYTRCGRCIGNEFFLAVDLANYLCLPTIPSGTLIWAGVLSLDKILPRL